MRLVGAASDSAQESLRGVPHLVLDSSAAARHVDSKELLMSKNMLFEDRAPGLEEQNMRAVGWFLHIMLLKSPVNSGPSIAGVLSITQLLHLTRIINVAQSESKYVPGPPRN